ncbi:MAG TPA: hydrogenase small subunit [Burkholderiales bacterium]
MKHQQTIQEVLREQGISRRRFLKYCAVTASMLALSPKQAAVFAQVLGTAPRPSVIWLSFQQCTGCSESLLRSFDPSVENLLLNLISLDYHESLQVAAGIQAEDARKQAMQANFGNYVLVVDGSIPTGEAEWWSTVAGNSNLATLTEAINGAAFVVALGTCATFGGVPAAYPNPSSASGVGDLMAAGLVPTKALVNVSGCPPIPEVITGTIAYYLVNKALPELDALKRPKVFYGKTVHDCCPRLDHFNAGNFAQSHGDDGAKQGYCLYLLGCKGPETFNSCTTIRWNQGTSFPMHSGHGCLGCSEPGFWDKKVTVKDPVTGVKNFIGGSSFYGAGDAEFATGDGSGCTAPPPLVRG